jgi:hypothetical protein
MNEGAEDDKGEEERVLVTVPCCLRLPKLLTDILRLPDSAGRGSHDLSFLALAHKLDRNRTTT